MQISEYEMNQIALAIGRNVWEDHKKQDKILDFLQNENKELKEKTEEQRKQIVWRDKNIVDYKKQIIDITAENQQNLEALEKAKSIIEKLNIEIVGMSKLPASGTGSVTKPFPADSSDKKYSPASEPKTPKTKRTTKTCFPERAKEKKKDAFDPATAKVEYLPDVRGNEIPSRSPREIRFDTVERKLKNAGFERFDKGNDESIRKYKKSGNKDICVLMISEVSRPQLVVDEVPCHGVDDAIARAGK